MLLDTGADVTLIPKSAVYELGLTPGSEDSYELIAFDGSRSELRVGDQVLERSDVNYYFQYDPGRRFSRIGFNGSLGDSIDFANIRVGQGGNFGLFFSPTRSTGRRCSSWDMPTTGCRTLSATCSRRTGWCS
jgi:hypothetical protein